MRKISIFKKNLSLILLLAFCSLLGFGCDFVYRLLQREGAEEKELIGEINPLERNSKIEEVQKLLKLYGYKVGTADGKMVSLTRDAIASFQEDNELKVSRFVDKATWSKLNEFVEAGLVSN